MPLDSQKETAQWCLGLASGQRTSVFGELRPDGHTTWYNSMASSKKAFKAMEPRPLGGLAIVVGASQPLVL